MRPLIIGKVYRVTISYGYGPKKKRRILGRFVGRLYEVDETWARFRECKRVTRSVFKSAIVNLRFVEEG